LILSSCRVSVLFPCTSLFRSGAGDFRRLIEAVQGEGVKVTVCSTIRGMSPLVADELRRQADDFLDLDDIRHEIARAGQTNDGDGDRKSTRLNSSHVKISYAVF